MESLDEVINFLPGKADIDEALYEGSDVVLYTQSKDFFLDNENTVKRLVSKLKKRVEIRPAAAIRIEPAVAQEKIEALTPEEAGFSECICQPEFGTVVIRVEKPGLAIGKNGELLEKIKKETFWMPKVQRVPAIDSKIVDRAREIVMEDAAFRKKFLHEVGEKIRLQKSTGEEWVRVTGLGSWREVGRSCMLLQTEESKVMLDCGINSAAQGRERFPILDVPEANLQDLDAVIISHAHMDHQGFLPYLFDYGYDGPVYCTEPTRDLMILLQLDYIDLARKEGETAPYDSTAIKKAVKHCIPVEYGTVTDITPDMRLTLHNAGHILGSSSVHIHIGEGLHNVVYTGDYKHQKTELLRPANPDFNRVETVITESTYGGKRGKMEPREKSKKYLLDAVERTLGRGGKVMIPAFAVGRSQEIMLMLADAVKTGRISTDQSIYLDGMIWDATALHTAYPKYLSKKVQRQIFHEDDNPFLRDNFFHVGSHQERGDVVEEQDPSIILTTSGMLQGGPIFYYLEQLAENEDNMLLFTGYQAEGTLGRLIQGGRKKVSVNDEQVKINCEVDTVEGLSGHSDRDQMMDYLRKLPNKPDKIICNHGDEKATYRFASTLYKTFNTDTDSPHNLETIRLH